MCDARFFRPELSKPLIGSPEICFGLPPNFSEESVKEANDLLVNAIILCGVFSTIYLKNLTHEVLVLPHRIETKNEEVKYLVGSSVIELILIIITRHLQ